MVVGEGCEILIAAQEHGISETMDQLFEGMGEECGDVHSKEV